MGLCDETRKASVDAPFVSETLRLNLRRAINHYLKWAVVEAANIAIRTKIQRHQHIGLLYQRLYPAKGHGRAGVAVARHLAEASCWALCKRHNYRA